MDEPKLQDFLNQHDMIVVILRDEMQSWTIFGLGVLRLSFRIWILLALSARYTVVPCLEHDTQHLRRGC